MRISDWSSDVCSSDLALRIVGDALEVRAATDEHHLAPDRPDEMQVLQRPADLPHHRVETLPYHRDELGAGDAGRFGPRRRARIEFDDVVIVARGSRSRTIEDLQPLRQIGRATCRERVWQ